MTAFEMVAGIVLLLVGYWAISAIWRKRKKAPWHEVLGVPVDASLACAKLERAYEQALAARKSA